MGWEVSGSCRRDRVGSFSGAGGKPNFGNLTFTVRNATFAYGAFPT